MTNEVYANQGNRIKIYFLYPHGKSAQSTSLRVPASLRAINLRDGKICVICVICVRFMSIRMVSWAHLRAFRFLSSRCKNMIDNVFRLIRVISHKGGGQFLYINFDAVALYANRPELISFRISQAVK